MKSKIVKNIFLSLVFILPITQISATPKRGGDPEAVTEAHGNLSSNERMLLGQKQSGMTLENGESRLNLVNKLIGLLKQLEA